MIGKTVRTALTAFALAGAVYAGSASAQEMIEAQTDWSVYVDSATKVCFVVSQPTKSEAKRGGQSVTARRGDIRFHIAVIPGINVGGEPSFMAGYPLRTDGSVEVQIKGEKFDMFPDPAVNAEYAWPDPAQDANIIAAMKKGADAIVTGISARGTTTIDTFSLRGFTAAVEKAQELCK
ncbi:MAG TPA: invasion associated locus B family protein [Paracoccaceae bacterium]|nr:invasion associated locus B family protein [Paracoccaceae bacterium]